jgi:Flp pilus assembly protein TadB
VKILLVPVAILAFIVFLIVLGAIGLGIAFLILATFGKIWKVLTRAERRRERREARMLDF